MYNKMEKFIMQNVTLHMHGERRNTVKYTQVSANQRASIR